MTRKPPRRRRKSVRELLGHAPAPLRPARVAFTIAVMALWALIALGYKNTAPRPSSNAYVDDRAGIVSSAASAQLAAGLDHLRQQTGAQVHVETVSDLRGQTIEAYAVQEFQRLGLGRKGIDDGVLFVLAPNQRQARIEVGYGLEGELTDVASSLILRHRVVPAIRKNQIDTALLQGGEGIVLALHGTWDTTGAEHWQPRQNPDHHGPLDWLLAAIATAFIGGFSLVALNLWAPWPNALPDDGTNRIGAWLSWILSSIFSWLMDFTLLFFWLTPGTMLAGRTGGTIAMVLYALAFPLLKYLNANNRYRYLALPADKHRALRPRNFHERAANALLATAGGLFAGNGRSSGGPSNGSSDGFSGGGSSGGSGGGSSGGGGASAS